MLGVDAASLVGFILICCWVLPPIPNFRLRAARDFARSGIPAASNAASLVCFRKLRLRDRRRARQRSPSWLLLPRVRAWRRVSDEDQPGAHHGRSPRPVTRQERRRGPPPPATNHSDDHADSLPTPDRARDRGAEVRHVVLRARMAGIDRSGPDLDHRRGGHACRAGCHRLDAGVRPTSSRNAVGLGTFLRLCRSRFRRGPLRSTGRRDRRGGSAHDVPHHLLCPAVSRLCPPSVQVDRQGHSSRRSVLASCLAAVALPVSMLASTLGIPIVPYLLIIALAGGDGLLPQPAPVVPDRAP